MAYDHDYRTGLAGAPNAVIKEGSTEQGMAQHDAIFHKQQRDRRMNEVFALFVKARELRQDAAFMTDFRSWMQSQRDEMMKTIDEIAG